MACSKQDIERKRQAALQKLQAQRISLGKSQPNINHSPIKTSNVQNTTLPELNAKSPVTGGRLSYHPYSRSDSGRKPDLSVPRSNKVVSGTVYLISEERFEVSPSEFCAPLIDVFKTIPSKSYDSNTKLWNFSVDHYHLLMSRVAPLAPDVVLGPIPDYILKVIKEQSINPMYADISPVEPTLRHKLKPFQEEGVRFGIAKRGRCMIADDMGLGKTFQALAVASFYKTDWPMLIVTTSSMRETWQSKIHELLPSVPRSSIAVVNGNKDAEPVEDRRTEVVIVSFKMAVPLTKLLKDKKFGVVIIDESHNLKSHKSRCTESLTAISRSAARVLLLSGTPALSRPAELYTQLSIIEPHFCGGYINYGKRYCAGKMTQFGWDMSGQSNLAELQVLLQKKFLIRRTKEQVLNDLEEKTRESILLDQTLLEFSKQDQQQLSEMAETYTKTRSSERHAALVTFFSQSSRIKIPAICKYIRELVKEEPSTKFLVFAHHKNVVEAVCLTLDEAEVRYICIVGGTPATSRKELVDIFQTNPSCRCAVLSTTAANSGITLTAASLVLFAELHWNPGVLTQAESRAHRIGQSSQVRVRYLLARGTADDYMWPMLQDKLNVLNEVGLSKDTYEDTTQLMQDSKNKISQYLTQRNPNDFIPGTNIRKDSERHRQADSQPPHNHRQEDHKLEDTVHRQDIDEAKSILENIEDDELLAEFEFDDLD